MDSLPEDIKYHIILYILPLKILCKYKWAFRIIKSQKLDHHCWYQLCRNKWAFSFIKINIHTIPKTCLYDLNDYEWAKKFIKSNKDIINILES